MAWISQNIGTIIVCLLLFGIIAAITVSLIKKKRRGESSCGCSGCPMSDSCGKKE
ncbi:MAG: FeoB-associated Cys-rich membrane protein [Clostridia bacterium]|nr:FeoB-associated Cys-rich membrane protein [Clostridia bacterium]